MLDDTATEAERQVAARVREYTDTFGRAFHERDVTRLRPYCRVPATVIGGGRLQVIENEEVSDARWTRVHAALPADYDHSLLHTVDVTMTDSHTAFVTIDCSRLLKSGETLMRFHASSSWYVRKAATGWWRPGSVTALERLRARCDCSD